jgi:N-acetyl-gamma-glutamyl-phosphate reductase
MPRGILATCTAPVAEGVTIEVARSILTETYDGERFITVLEPGQWPRTADVAASNAVHLQVAVDETAGRVVAISAIDNLVKGAAGQAIQNANLALGISEAAGLTSDGVAP